MADSHTDLTTGCHDLIYEFNTPYGFVPAPAVGVVFCTLFGVLAGIHTVQTIIYRRTWWTLLFVAGCLGRFGIHVR